MTDLDLIVEAAREAGALAQRLQTAGLRIEKKPDGTPVTDGDLAVDAFLAGRLQAARPDYGWLSEETQDTEGRLKARRLFIIDPIDGTRAYMRGRPWWVVSIAVVEEGRPIAGALVAPALDEVYAAASGSGATLNGRAIRVSDAPRLEGCRMLSDAAMLQSPDWPRAWPAMTVETRNAVAYRMALVAAGAFDAALALSAKAEWDLAAAALIVEEAGGVSTDHLGRAFRFNTPSARAPSLICAGPRLHRLILERTSPIDLGAS